MLDDPAAVLTIGSQKLNGIQKTALASGYALYIPENNTYVTRHLLYCKANIEEGRIEHSSKPFNVKTYMMKDGLLHPLPEEKKAVQKTENKNKRSNNRIK